MNKRASGVLLHISCLPSPFGIGDFGPGAYRFVDFLKESGQQYWQILPFNPTEIYFNHSPYSGPSAFAGNILFVSPELLLQDDLLKHDELKVDIKFQDDCVDYIKAVPLKKKFLSLAFDRFKEKKIVQKSFEEFCLENQHWLDDCAFFMLLKSVLKELPWPEWPKEYRDRKIESLKEILERFSDEIKQIKFFQYLFFKQWALLRAYAHSQGVKIVGDIPIYVSSDSVDVWVNPDIFKLDRNKNPKFIAGVPPDYFSKTGQRWGNPVYNWSKLKKTKYVWWVQRIKHNLKLFDYIRIDHFRGFVAYWQVSVKERTATRGRWVPAPAKIFFKTLKKNFKELPIIAEDMGYITKDVTELVNSLRFPGMKVLLFAFDGKEFRKNTYLPENFTNENCIVYTGTHDNNTVRGWFESEASDQEKENVFKYFGPQITKKNIHWEFIKSALASKANLAIIPLQDLLGLGKEARMNTPATMTGNWVWRLDEGNLNSVLSKEFKQLTLLTNRLAIP